MPDQTSPAQRHKLIERRNDPPASRAEELSESAAAVYDQLGRPVNWSAAPNP